MPGGPSAAPGPAAASREQPEGLQGLVAQLQQEREGLVLQLQQAEGQAKMLRANLTQAERDKHNMM